jgi:hypothetical protein
LLVSLLPCLSPIFSCPSLASLVSLQLWTSPFRLLLPPSTFFPLCLCPLSPLCCACLPSHCLSPFLISCLPSSSLVSPYLLLSPFSFACCPSLVSLLNPNPLSSFLHLVSLLLAVSSFYFSCLLSATLVSLQLLLSPFCFVCLPTFSGAFTPSASRVSLHLLLLLF